MTAKKRPPFKQKVNASVFFYGADMWTPQGRRDIAAWLTRTAKQLTKHGSTYGPRFRARYLSK